MQIIVNIRQENAAGIWHLDVPITEEDVVKLAIEKLKEKYGEGAQYTYTHSNTEVVSA